MGGAQDNSAKPWKPKPVRLEDDEVTSVDQGCPSCNPSKDAGPDSRNGILRSSSPFILALYLLVSFLFAGFYFQTTIEWTPDDFSDYTYSSGRYAIGDPVLRFRVLVPLLARGVDCVLGVNLQWMYQVLAGLCVFGSLIAYRRYLSNFLRADFSSILSVAIVYPMLWNFCLLNRIYFPFDLPGLLFFVMGCHFIYCRNWGAYYPTLALATLNRETSCFLMFIFLVCLYRKVAARRLVWHLLAQTALWISLRCLVFLVVGDYSEVLSKLTIAFNARVILDMLALRGNGLKDWAKLGLAFGGIWWALPRVIRGQPVFLKRCLLVVVPFVIAVGLKGVVDEVRVYAELIPIVLTPVVVAVAAELGGTRSGLSADDRGRE